MRDEWKNARLSARENTKVYLEGLIALMIWIAEII